MQPCERNGIVKIWKYPPPPPPPSIDTQPLPQKCNPPLIHDAKQNHKC